MKITRHNAIAMLRRLGVMALGHLDDASLASMLDNIAALEAVARQKDALETELHKRLFEGVDVKRCEEFDKLVEQKDMETIDKDYADIKALVTRKVNAMEKVLLKEVEIELVTVDKTAFVKAVLKAQPTTPQATFAALAPIFGEADAEADYSELDNL
jgi:hypothetical protein